MGKKQAIINFLLLLLLFSFIKSSELKTLDFNFETNSVSTKETEAQTFRVLFEDKTKISNYIEVEAFSEDDSPAPLLCFSTSDPNCISREQMVKNASGKNAVMWLKKDEFYENELYINVKCEKENCSYNLTIKGDNYATFGPNFVYSYLVGTNNTEMQFQVQGTEKNVYMILALEGSTKASLNIEDDFSISEIQFKTGSIIYFFLEDIKYENISFNFIVNGGEIGEYLTLSVHLVEVNDSYNGLAVDQLLLPNGPEITSYLENEKINKECFPLNLSDSKYNSMNQLYITGRIYTKYAWFYLEEEDRNMEGSKLEILDGQVSYVIKNNGKMNYICFELPNESTFNQKKMVFSFSLTEPNSLSDLYNYYPPQLTGEIYRRIIPKGSIAFFSGTKNNITVNKYDYSLYRRIGLTKMYIGDCRNYPNCHYNVNELENLIAPKAINKMAIWTTETDKSSVIGREKYVIVAYCEDDGNDENEFCEFETSIFSKSQDIYLGENEKFSKYVIAGEKGKFIIDLPGVRQMKSLTVDIMLFSGDVTFKTNLDIEYGIKKYYLSNKICYEISFLDNFSIDSMIIEYYAEINSFFNIQYGVDSLNYQQIEEIVPSGESYLVQIDPTSISRIKNILLLNQFYKNKNPFLVNFFELNCQFEVTRGNVSIGFFDGYAQEILDKNTDAYNSEYYEYKIKIIEPDFSNYNHKMCMLYIAGYEAETKYDREIVVGENINQQIIFNDNFKKVRFLYPKADVNKDLTVHINVIDKAFYNIKIFVNDYNINKAIVTRTQTFYLKGSVLINKCNQNTLCPIIVEAIYDKKIVNTNPMLEITIREVKNTPTYLQKGKAKLDFVCGSRFYYLYTEIGKNEIGEITVNFLREFGNIWGRVVNRYQSLVDEGANWRGIYRMPSSDYEDSKPYNEYLKKLIFLPKDTTDCIEGCYLLLSLQISKIDDLIDDQKFYPFSIITKIYPSTIAYTEIPKIVIQVNEFVIGNIDISQNERIYEFFEVWLPHDSPIVEFDFQSSVAGLYITLGGIKPTTKNADFKLLPPGRETILSLTKEEILYRAKIKKINIPYENSLEDVNLVIGVWANKTDSIDTELYSLKVHQPRLATEDTLEILLVKTDQKIMCNPKNISSNEYRCLFVVTYDDKDVNLLTPLLAYAASINQEASNYMYGNYIEREIYDEYIVDNLTSKIPTFEESELNNRIDDVEYIYTSKLQKGKYIFISVITDRPDPIMILTFMPIYNYLSHDLFEYKSNPTGEQLLAFSCERLRLDFPVINSIMVDIVTLNGYAEIYWKNEPEKVYILRGAEDRISLFSGNSIEQLIIRRLDTNNDNKLLTAMEDPGFVFYIKYYIKEPKNNFYKVNNGKSVEVAFKETDLPIYLYNKIGTCEKDVIITLTFKDFIMNKKGEYYSSPLNISAAFVKEDTLYMIKENPDIIPTIKKSIIGKYDPSIKTAQIYFKNSVINKYDIASEENPTLYLSIEKNDFFIQQNYKYFSIDVQISLINSEVIPTKNIYNYYKYPGFDIISHRLKISLNKKYMALEISFNSDFLDFSINKEKTKSTDNTLIINSINEKGKIIKAIDPGNLEYIYLNIFKKDNSINNKFSLNNYVFKYYFIESIEDIIDYKILDNNNEISIINNKTEGKNIFLEVVFNKIDLDVEESNITYYMKIIDGKKYYKNESYESIALIESPHYTVYEINPPDNNGKITLNATIDLCYSAYIQVIALIEKDNNIEYISYKGINSIISDIEPEPEYEEEEVIEEEEIEEEENEEEEIEEEIEEEENEEDNKEDKEGDDEDSKKNVYIILISVFSFIIIVILILLIIHCIRKKNIDNKIEGSKDETILPPRQMEE